jgi:hypothetical protein
VTKKKAKYDSEKRKARYRRPHSVLVQRYSDMKLRVAGKPVRGGETAQPWLGLPILSKEEFMAWGKANKDFYRIFDEWAAAGYPQRLAPSVDRLDDDEGYLLDNMAIVPNWQNSDKALAKAHATNAKKRAEKEARADGA